MPDNSEIQNPTNYIKNMFVAAPSSIRVYEDADLDTLDFIDSDGIVGSCVPGNEMMPSKVFKGYGKNGIICRLCSNFREGLSCFSSKC